MIDFRYHLVSIVAVFLALAIGIVVGAEALSPKFASTLSHEAQQVAKRNSALYAENARLKQQISADNSFAQAASGYLLKGLLTGESVVVVTAPGASGQEVSGITTALRKSGATVTGQVSLTSQFFDTTAITETALTSLASQVAPAGVSLPVSPPVALISGQEAAGQVIAAAIMTRAGQAGLSRAQSQSILSGFGQQGYLHVSGPNGAASLSGQASLAVVVIPAVVPSPVNASSSANLALVALTAELQRAGTGSLLAGTVQGSGAGSAIDAVTSGSAGITVTTVDNADTEVGQVIVVQALRQLLNPHATPASYGVRSAAVPSPAPTAAPSPSASPTPSASPGRKTVRG